MNALNIYCFSGLSENCWPTGYSDLKETGEVMIVEAKREKSAEKLKVFFGFIYDFAMCTGNIF